MSELRYPNVWAMLYNQPLMLHEPVAQQFAGMFAAILEHGLAGAQALAAGSIKARPDREAFAGNVQPGQAFGDKPYILTDAGVAILPVMGVMVQRRGQLSPDCTEMTSYQKLGMRFDAMMADPDVKGVLLEIDSPGGQVAGNFELAAKVAAAAKPVWAHANEMAFSGGYSLAASAERLYTPMTGMVGSIGVIMQHVDQSAKDEKAGYKFTTIKAGANKDIFNPHKPLAKQDREWAQASVDRARDLFAQLVAQGRKMDLKAVLDTEAGLFEATDAKSIGLVDDIATFAETLAAFEQRLASGPSFVFSTAASRQPPKETSMSTPDKPAAAAAAPDKPATAAPAAPQPSAAAPAAATVDQKARIAAILNHAEAKGRDDLAKHLAFDTDLSVEAAAALLAKSPKAGAANPLAAAMGQVPNPKVGSDAGTDADPGQPRINTAGIYLDRAKAVAAAR